MGVCSWVCVDVSVCVATVIVETPISIRGRNQYSAFSSSISCVSSFVSVSCENALVFVSLFLSNSGEEVYDAMTWEGDFFIGLLISERLFRLQKMLRFCQKEGEMGRDLLNYCGLIFWPSTIFLRINKTYNLWITCSWEFDQCNFSIKRPQFIE